MSLYVDAAGTRTELDGSGEPGGRVGSAVLPQVIDPGASVAPWWLVAAIGVATGVVLLWVVLWRGGRR